MNILIRMIGFQFKMLLRDKGLLISSLGIALISMLIFGTVFGNNTAIAIKVGLVDLDKSAVSGQVTAALKQNQAVSVTEGEQTNLVTQLKEGKQAAVVVLQPGFGAGLAKAEAKVQYFADQSDIIGAARAKGTIYGIFDRVSKQAGGFKDLIQVEEQAVTARQFRQIDILTPGMLGLTIMFANMPIGLALITWRQRGTLKRLNATPLKAWQLVISQIIAHLALSLGQAAVILGLGMVIFNVQVRLEWLPLIGLFTVAGTFSIIALGYVIGNFVPRREAAQQVVTLISLPMMFLGGSYFVTDNVPDFLKPLVDILPLTHLNRAFRGIMLNGAGLDGLLINLVVLLTFGIVLLILSIRTFRWSR